MDDLEHRYGGLDDETTEDNTPNDNNSYAELEKSLTRDDIAKIFREELGKLNLEKSVNRNDNNIASAAKDVIQFEVINKNVSTKRDYKLTTQTKFEHFYDYLTSELREIDLLYVISPADSSDKNKRLDEDTKSKNKFRVRDILINRLEPKYYSRVTGIQDPQEIVQKLKEIKRSETNLTSVVIRKQLYALQYDVGKETASEFIEKFEDITRNYENLDGTKGFTDEEKRDAFYNAIMMSVPEIQSVEFMTKSTNDGKGLSLEALKTFITQAEANKNQLTGTNSKGGNVNKTRP